MVNGKMIVVVMPAYNAENTLEKTYSEIPFEIVDDVILVDDASHDRTSEIALRIGIKPSSTRKTWGMAGTRRVVTGRPWNSGRTSLSWSIPTISTLPG
jgi:glycosyltransferase involved in cell wall biosynthesis